jgi:hypothetical protein
MKSYTFEKKNKKKIDFLIFYYIYSFIANNLLSEIIGWTH